MPIFFEFNFQKIKSVEILGIYHMHLMGMQPYIFYHPLKVVFLDDNRAFLDALELEFDTSLNLSTYTDFKDAMQTLYNNHESLLSSAFKRKRIIDSDSINDAFDLQLNQITNTLYDKKRFDQVAILVIDYDMPNINGVEICRKIKNRNLYKIMLTAEADKDTAIEAFNENIIDKFILKTQSNLYESILSTIENLTQNYFQQLSESVVNIYFNSIKKLVNNSAYLKLFQQILLKTKAVEYYMIDDSGSFLFLDENGQSTWLIVRSNKELDEQDALLEGYELSSNLKESLTTRKKMLFLNSEEDYKKPVWHWAENFYQLNKLDDDYFYSIINRSFPHSDQGKSIVSYVDYLKRRS